MPTRIAFQLHQKGVVGGRIFEEGDRLVEVDGVGERREDGAERSGRSGAEWDGARRRR